MWSELPKNLKTALGLAILGAVGVAAAAFRLSFIALREVASDPQLKFGKGNGWLLPIVIDAALVVSEVILLAASMVRVRNKRGELETYDRTVPFLLVAIFGGATIYFNVTRVPSDLRAVTVIPPAASILMTLALAYLMKMLARVSGADHIYEAPPPLDPRQITRKADVIHADLVRGPDPSGPPGSPFPGYGAGTFPPQGPYGQMPSPAQPGTPQIGHAEIDEATKRRAVEMYLSGLTAEQLGIATGSSVVVGVAARGIALDERYARRILDEYKAVHKPANGARTSVRRKA